MSSRNFRMSLIVFLGLSLGFILPQIGLILKPLLTYLLMVLMFFTCLKMNLSDFRKIKLKTIMIALSFSLVFTPVMSLGGILLTPLIFTGILLAFSCPSAAASAFFSDVFQGDSSLAIILITMTSFISIVSLPLTMLIGVGTSIKFDVVSMIINLTLIILVPLIASYLFRKYSKQTCEKMIKYDKTVSYAIITFILWGGVASGISYVESNVYEFLNVNLIVTLLLAVAFMVPYFLMKMLGKKVATTLAITAFMKNGIIALVIGSAAFGSGVLPATVANLIDQNLILVLLGLLKRK